MNTNDWIGTIGVGLILIAYFCSTFNWMSRHSRIFFLLNTVGAAMACCASYLISYWPFCCVGRNLDHCVFDWIY